MRIKLKLEVLKVFTLDFEMSTDPKAKEEEQNEETNAKVEPAPKHPGGIQ